MFHGTDVLALEVSQKSISALPCCMGVTFFLIRTQRGSAIFTVDDTSPARMRFFFNFFNTSTARIKKINEIAPGSLCLDEPARKTRKANRQEIVVRLPRLRTGHVFQIDKISSKATIIVCIPQGITRIATWALTCEL